MISIWILAIVFAIISLITGNPAALIAGLVISTIGILVERWER